MLINQDRFRCAGDAFGNGSDWLSSCNLQFTLNMFSVNSRRVENLQSILQTAIAYNASCTTAQCRTAMAVLIDAYTPIAVAAAAQCVSPACRTLVAGSKDQLKLAIQRGVVGALDQEKVRFDTMIQQEALQKLQEDTYAFSVAVLPASRTACSGSCLNSLMLEVNTSYAVNGYIAGARGQGFQIYNGTVADQILRVLVANFTRCTEAVVCKLIDAGGIYRAKRAVQRYIAKWQERLAELNQNCTRPACNLDAEIAATNERAFLASDYFTQPIYVPGLATYSFVLLATIAVAVCGIMWSTVRGKELFWLVLVGIVMNCSIRISFWAVGASGVGTTSLTFIILDKLGSLFFALTIFVFVYMWAKAVAVLMEAPKWVIIALTVAVITISAAIIAVSIYYAVSISRTFVSAFFSIFTVDNAEIVLSVFTVFLATCLFVFILIVGRWLKNVNSTQTATASSYHSGRSMNGGGSSIESKLDEKLKNLRMIAVAVGVMILFLLMRMIIVIMRNYYADFFMGYSALYIAATVIPEVICDLIMLGLVLFTFYQSRHVSLKTLSTNSSYQAGSSANEMRNLGPETGSVQSDDRYDV